MKYSIGYQLPGEDEPPFFEQVSDYADSIGEVYFPWPDMPSGRAPMGAFNGYVDWKGREKLFKDLGTFADRGIGLNLLLNANCYGGESVSARFENYIVSVIECLLDGPGLDRVTASSPAAAHAVKKHFPEIRVRASVNMRIGTVNAMDAVSDLFDGFCVRREINRNPEKIKKIKAWADSSGKSLTMLANSG